MSHITFSLKVRMTVCSKGTDRERAKLSRHLIKNVCKLCENRFTSKGAIPPLAYFPKVKIGLRKMEIA